MSSTLPPVRGCRLDEVLALRQAVLRPHQRLEELVFPGDDDPRAAHFCAEDALDGIISVASVLPEAPQWEPSAAPAWRLRAMATVPKWRGRGVGASLLCTAIAHVRARGGGLFWCNARLGAVGFYEKAGLTTIGEPFEVPVIGPHIAMWAKLPTLAKSKNGASKSTRTLRRLPRRPQ